MFLLFLITILLASSHTKPAASSESLEGQYKVEPHLMLMVEPPWATSSETNGPTSNTVNRACVLLGSYLLLSEAALPTPKMFLQLRGRGEFFRFATGTF